MYNTADRAHTVRSSPVSTATCHIAMPVAVDCQAMTEAAVPLWAFVKASASLFRTLFSLAAVALTGLTSHLMRRPEGTAFDCPACALDTP